MAENNVTGSGRVLFQKDDDLNETNLADVAAKSNQTDYVERGLSITYDSNADTIDIGSGHAVIEDGNQAYDVFPDAESDLSLPNAGGNNYVFLEHDPATQDDVQYHIDDDDTAPSNPSLKIAVVDANANNVDEKNRNPDATFRSADADYQLAIPVFSSDADAPNETQYYHSGDNKVKYKDSAGTVRTSGGLQDGQDFDGQGTSDISDLSSVATESADIGKLLAALDANGQDINNVGALDTNSVTNVKRIDGKNGNHRINFDDSNYMEITDQSDNRSDLVTNRVYFNTLGSWINDSPVNNLDADKLDGKHADEISGFSADNFNRESGTYTHSSQYEGTNDVSFNNTYHSDAVHVSVGATVDQTSTAGARVTSYNTDDNGNVTGATITHDVNGNYTATVTWNVTGITV